MRVRIESPPLQRQVTDVAFDDFTLASRFLVDIDKPDNDGDRRTDRTRTLLIAHDERTSEQAGRQTSTHARRQARTHARTMSSESQSVHACTPVACTHAWLHSVKF